MLFQRILLLAIATALSCAVNAAHAAGTMNTLATIAERSGDTRTGRYEEVERLCEAYAAKWPQAVRCFEFGRTPEGRPIFALAASYLLPFVFIYADPRYRLPLDIMFLLDVLLLSREPGRSVESPLTQAEQVA